MPRNILSGRVMLPEERDALVFLTWFLIWFVFCFFIMFLLFLLTNDMIKILLAMLPMPILDAHYLKDDASFNRRLIICMICNNCIR